MMRSTYTCWWLFHHDVVVIDMPFHFIEILHTFHFPWPIFRDYWLIYSKFLISHDNDGNMEGLGALNRKSIYVVYSELSVENYLNIWKKIYNFFKRTMLSLFQKSWILRQFLRIFLLRYIRLRKNQLKKSQEVLKTTKRSHNKWKSVSPGSPTSSTSKIISSYFQKS